jgi:hypothetical protein
VPIEFEPGPFTDVAPLEPPAPFAAPRQFARLLDPYANLFAIATAGIDTLHAQMSAEPGFDHWAPSVPQTADALNELGAIAAVDDSQALASALANMAAVRSELADQLLDLPGPDDGDVPIPPDPGPPPGWGKDEVERRDTGDDTEAV